MTTDTMPKRKPKHDPNENHELFNKYVMPNLDEIRSLTFFYTNNKQEVDSNYNDVLTEMYKYIHTYNPEKSLKTWIHIVTKRVTQNRNKRQYDAMSHNHGIVYDFDHDNGDDEDQLECGANDMIVGGLLDNISDTVLEALQQTPPAQLSAFILYYQGYSAQEIVDIEYKRGYLDTNSPEAMQTVMNRVYMAKKSLKKSLSKNGIERTEQLL